GAASLVDRARDHVEHGGAGHQQQGERRPDEDGETVRREDHRVRSQTRRSPSSVRDGSTRTIETVCGAIRSASPPVAIAGASGAARSARISRTMPSPCPAKPYTIPDCRAPTVVFAITVGGSAKSTRTSRAARANSASMEISIPGASTPPTYSPSGETTSKLVDVPKSTTMHGAPYRSTAATAFAIRSGPTSRGSS